ncbi:MAG: hypothetical protein HYT49_03640 [Candidatus Wildermuthbacteria bacterium]|nr:hypothetical protein [Candidatus Wildermuthbacteria bacterium]
MDQEKGVTIDDLARMVQKGFEETAKTSEVRVEFDEVKERLDRIENILLAENRRRIEKLEDQMREVRDALAMNNK